MGAEDSSQLEPIDSEDNYSGMKSKTPRIKQNHRVLHFDNDQPLNSNGSLVLQEEEKQDEQ